MNAGIVVVAVVGTDEAVAIRVARHSFAWVIGTTSRNWLASSSGEAAATVLIYPITSCVNYDFTGLTGQAWSIWMNARIVVVAVGETSETVSIRICIAW